MELFFSWPYRANATQCAYLGPGSAPAPPTPPRIYRLGHLDTLVQLPGRVLSIHQGSRNVYEKLPYKTWLPPEPETEEQEIDLEAEERQRLRTAGPTVKRVGKTLILRPTATKQPLRLVNNPVEDYDKNVSYEYVGSLPEIKQWLLSVHLYEGGYFLLIDQRTGRRTRIWSPPAVAPDGRHFVCGNSDVLARYEPSGLQVWHVDGPKLEKLWERQTEWGVTGPRWLDNKTILFEQDFFDNGDVDTRVVRMKVVP
ncbi:hypothetical protein [Hymenobacter cellulosilyticus]|uniref:Uncharacterized protein n=1 Tax=Hymenobacter cellulosilyticus TaxID=2932248 RepID=A0A8T9Q9S5_9BACT|nr:hypothetical protein [Hymenobacter cellulosilyticus]UOQ73885.1 hypothetical protein MUN79_08245 [Hymenobacter cellulosilyticus]